MGGIDALCIPNTENGKNVVDRSTRHSQLHFIHLALLFRAAIGRIVRGRLHHAPTRDIGIRSPLVLLIRHIQGRHLLTLNIPFGGMIRGMMLEMCVTSESTSPRGRTVAFMQDLQNTSLCLAVPMLTPLPVLLPEDRRAR